MGRGALLRLIIAAIVASSCVLAQEVADVSGSSSSDHAAAAAVAHSKEDLLVSAQTAGRYERTVRCTGLPGCLSCTDFDGRTYCISCNRIAGYRLMPRTLTCGKCIITHVPR